MKAPKECVSACRQSKGARKGNVLRQSEGNVKVQPSDLMAKYDTRSTISATAQNERYNLESAHCELHQNESRVSAPNPNAQTPSKLHKMLNTQAFHFHHTPPERRAAKQEAYGNDPRDQSRGRGTAREARRPVLCCVGVGCVHVRVYGEPCSLRHIHTDTDKTPTHPKYFRVITFY